MTANLANDALDHQLDILRWTQTTIGERYCNVVIDEAMSDWGGVESATGVALFQQTLTLAETYAVSTEICDLLEQAAPSLPSVNLRSSDLPSPQGFIDLERPWVLVDSKGADIVVRYVAWNTTILRATRRGTGPDGEAVYEHDVLVILLFTDPTDPRDHMHEEWLGDVKEHPRWVEHGWPSIGLPMLGGLLPLDLEVPVSNVEDSGWDDIAHFLCAFFRFIEETWVDSRVFVATKHAAKRARRKMVEPSIKVVRLRRAEQRRYAKREGEDVKPVEWDHRWLVRGHWRNQWYASESRHKPRWIPEYIKGPEDKPLIVHDHTFVVDR